MKRHALILGLAVLIGCGDDEVADDVGADSTDTPQDSTTGANDDGANTSGVSNLTTTSPNDDGDEPATTADDDDVSTESDDGNVTPGSTDGGESGTGVAGTEGDATEGSSGSTGGVSAQPINLQLLAFNDFHGQLEVPSGTTGGAAFFARFIADLEATEPNTMVVSAGDLIGATPLPSALFHDEPTIDFMNLVGLDLNAVGNHEFDDGREELLRMQYGGCHPTDIFCDAEDPVFEGADFQFLAANVIDESTQDSIFDRVVTRSFGGVDVAFIGMTLEATPTVVTPAGVAGLSFRDEVETVNAIVPELRGQGVEAIVVLVHEGGAQASGSGINDCNGFTGAIVSIVEQINSAVDVFVTGHTHQAYNCDLGDRLVTSAGSQGRILTDIDLLLDPETGDVISAEAVNLNVTREVAVPEIETFVQDYVGQAAPLANTEVGNITATVLRSLRDTTFDGAGQSPLGHLIADAQLAATEAIDRGGAEIAFMNPGGIRADLPFGDDGVVSFGEVFTVQPFGNSLVVMTLTGAQIYRVLEQQFAVSTPPRILQISEGFEYEVFSDGPPAFPIGLVPGSVRLDLEEIVNDDSQTYRVTVNSFLATGGDGFTVFNEGVDRVSADSFDIDAFAEFLAPSLEGAPIEPPILDRVTTVPPPVAP